MSDSFDPNLEAVLVRGMVSGPSGLAVKVTLVLDTGATTSVMNSDALTRVGYDPAASPDREKVLTGGGVQNLPRLVLNRLETLGQDRIDFPVLCHDFPPTAGIDGLLGLDFLRGLVLTLDFRVGFITLS
jgi:predicted aspartyl protease